MKQGEGRTYKGRERREREGESEWEKRRWLRRGSKRDLSTVKVESVCKQEESRWVELYREMYVLTYVPLIEANDNSNLLNWLKDEVINKWLN